MQTTIWHGNFTRCLRDLGIDIKFDTKNKMAIYLTINHCIEFVRKRLKFGTEITQHRTNFSHEIIGIFHYVSKF